MPYRDPGSLQNGFMEPKWPIRFVSEMKDTPIAHHIGTWRLMPRDGRCIYLHLQPQLPKFCIWINDFAHIPWEDTPHFLQKMLVKWSELSSRNIQPTPLRTFLVGDFWSLRAQCPALPGIFGFWRECQDLFLEVVQVRIDIQVGIWSVQIASKFRDSRTLSPGMHPEWSAVPLGALSTTWW